MSLITAVFLFVLSVVLILILWLLLVPVYILADSESNQYEISQWGSIRFHFHWNDGPVFNLRVFGFQVPLKKPTSKSVSTKPVKKEKGKLRKSFRQWVVLIRDMFNSITIRRFYAAIDTGDVVLNAKLVPVALLLSRGTGFFQVNFLDQTYVYLSARFYPAKAVYIFLRFYFKP